MAAVMKAEKALGHLPRDVSRHKLGYDIESIDGQTGLPRFIEVKGRIEGAETVTITRNEISRGLNKPDSFILALVQVPPSETFLEGDAFRVASGTGNYGAFEVPGCVVRHLWRPFDREPTWAEESVNFNWQKLWQRGNQPISC